jgi:hypothetical protein
MDIASDENSDQIPQQPLEPSIAESDDIPDNYQFDV